MCRSIDNETLSLSGFDTKTKEPVQFHFPKSIILKIQRDFTPKNKFQKVILWILKLFFLLEEIERSVI